MSRSTPLRWRHHWLEVVTIAAFCGFFFFFGLGAIGLTGADEPRYAQVAREMFARRDWVTPVLYGKPWLEKPVLYYWEAMLAYKVFGVSDWVARLPSACSASFLVFAVFMFMRRQNLKKNSAPGAAGPRSSMLPLDAALITAATAACIGFARAASTDMPLAATFTAAMLCWFVSVDQVDSFANRHREKISLAGFYFFLALATLAKGPIAPLLAGLIIILYAALLRRWKLVAQTLWVPGLLLFIAVAAPWYVAVQRANPQFAREFFLEQNLARFGTNLYRHKQPFWYYVPVLLAALVPWTVFAIVGLFKNPEARHSGRGIPATPEQPADSRAPSLRWKGDSTALFFLLWAVVPVIFFSFSESKLPGYILPAVPPWLMLLALMIQRDESSRPAWVLALLHALIAAGVTGAAIALPAILAHSRPSEGTFVAAMAVTVVLFAAILLTIRSRGLGWLRFVTLAPVIVALACVVRLDAPALDARVSVRPLALEIARTVPGSAPIAVFHARREVEYGLAFYFNQAILSYDRQEFPGSDHLVVARQGSAMELKEAAAGRRVSRIGEYPHQNLELFWISAVPKASVTH